MAKRDYPTPDVAFEPEYDNLGRVKTHWTYDYGPDPDEDVVKFEYTYESDENNIDKKYLKHRGATKYRGGL